MPKPIMTTWSGSPNSEAALPKELEAGGPHGAGDAKFAREKRFSIEEPGRARSFESG